MEQMVTYQKKLFGVVGERQLWLSSLGEGCAGFPLWIVKPVGYIPKVPRVLIAAGFHGEEKAGPWAILEWLKTFDQKVLKKIDVTFLPVANPSAFNRKSRYNYQNEKSNCGFCHPEKKEATSIEGQLILNNFDLITSSARDGFLSLHEDIDLSKEYYTYTFEDKAKPGDFTCGLLDCLSKYWEKPLNGYCASTDADLAGQLIVNGVAFKVCDGSLEDALFHAGVPRCAVVETPGKAVFKKRVECHMALIDEFIRLVLEEAK